jgi:adenosine deaminase
MREAHYNMRRSANTKNRASEKKAVCEDLMPSEKQSSMDFEQFVIALPKAELHLHLEGAVSASTAIELARKHGLPTRDFEDASKAFHFADLAEFLRAYDVICRSIVDADDFHRVTYETLARCAASGARYVEFFFSPPPHLDNGVAYATMLDGITAGMRDSERDLRIHSRLVPAINRELGPDIAMKFLDFVLSDRRAEVIGIGLDYDEAGHPPGPYAEVYRRAKNAGLHATAHAGENGPSENVSASLDLLGCERIDHGYHVVDDPALVAACRERGTIFTVCPTTTTHTTTFRDLASPEHAIRRMSAAGLQLVINTDDPALFRTDLAKEYQLASQKLGFSPKQLGAIALNGLRGSWLDEVTKRRWISDWSSEIDRLLANSAGLPPGESGMNASGQT